GEHDICAVSPRGERQFHRENSPVFPQAIEFQRISNHLRPARNTHTLKACTMSFSKMFRHENLDMRADDLIFRITEDFFRSPVPANDFGVLIRQNDGVWSGLDHRPEPE